VKPLSDTDRAAIRAYLCWRGFIEPVATRMVAEYEASDAERLPANAPRGHERDFKGAV